MTEKQRLLKLWDEYCDETLEEATVEGFINWAKMEDV